jgi:hypothetical protein
MKFPNWLDNYMVDSFNPKNNGVMHYTGGCNHILQQVIHNTLPGSIVYLDLSIVRLPHKQ